MARTKPFVKVHLGVADHPKTAAAWGDLALRAMLVELWRKAGEKYAGRRDDKVPLKPTDRMEIACSTDLCVADEAVERLCRALRYPLRKYPNRWEVQIRKFSKKQGFESKELDNISTTSLVPNSECRNSETPKLRTPSAEQDAAPSARPAKRARCAPRSPVPEALSDESRARIRAWAIKHGIEPNHLGRAWERFRGWWQGDGGLKADWEATFRVALTDGWPLKVGSPPTRPRDESTVEAKVRRTKEAAKRAVERIHRQPDPFAAVAIGAAIQAGDAP